MATKREDKLCQGDIRHILAVKYCFKIFHIKFLLNTKNIEGSKFFWP